jgi:PAS domain S-box-containing protein
VDPSFPIPSLIVFVLAQGAGSLFLALILGTLFAYRRQATFLYWALAWVCNGLWLILGGLNYYFREKGSTVVGWGEEPWLQHVAVLFGWWHAAFWGLSLIHFRRHGGKKSAEAPLPWSQWGVLAAVGVLAVLVSRSLTLEERSVLLGCVLAVLYLWGALVAAQYWKKVRRLPALFLSLGLALYALDRLHFTGFFLWVGTIGDLRSSYTSWTGLADGLAQTVLAIVMILFLLDTTQAELQETVLRLEESEERFRLIFEHSGVGMSLLAPDGRFVQVNPALVRMLGYTAEELRGRRLAEFVHGRDNSREVIRDPAESEMPSLYEREKRYIRKDGESIWARVLRVPIRDVAGVTRHFVGVLVNITERKRVEEALQQERDFSRQVLEAADVLIYVADSGGRLVHFNRTCSSVLGWSEDEVKGKLFWEVLLPQRNLDPVVDKHQQLVASKPERALPQAFEMHCKTRSGEERLVSWRNTTVRDIQGQVRYVIGTGIDVTEQRQLEEQLRQARRLESLGTLVGGIAHDFNNQLTAVLGQLGLVLDDLSQARKTSEPRVRELHAPLQQAAKAAQRCAEITQRLLTFSSGKVGPTSRISLDQLLADTIPGLQQDFPPSIQIHLCKGSDVWPVVADASSLQQVIQNLAYNARDAMPQGGELTLATANRLLQERDCLLNVEARAGQFVELSVQDTGTGMTAEVLGHLFEPFFTTKDPGRAAGMGLAVVYGIVKAHGGWITVQSAPAEGSTIRVYLPAAEPVTTTRPDSHASSEGGSECILVVDDEELVRGLAETVLRRAGYEVLTVADGEDALDLYRADPGRIDLILLDYLMPKMTGLEVMRELLQIDPQVCVVFTSGFTRDSDSDQLLTTGARAFLPKPYRPDDLLGTIRLVLDKLRLDAGP